MGGFVPAGRGGALFGCVCVCVCVFVFVFVFLFALLGCLVGGGCEFGWVWSSVCCCLISTQPKSQEVEEQEEE